MYSFDVAKDRAPFSTHVVHRNFSHWSFSEYIARTQPNLIKVSEKTAEFHNPSNAGWTYALYKIGNPFFLEQSFLP